ncbi:hypothetical protein Q666_12080 [Marinobacter sp. ES-1]|nr:hypothetical protein Q666_12080 [Marinobacter sp. ES-1]
MTGHVRRNTHQWGLPFVGTFGSLAQARLDRQKTNRVIGDGPALLAKPFSGSTIPNPGQRHNMFDALKEQAFGTRYGRKANIQAFG